MEELNLPISRRSLLDDRPKSIKVIKIDSEGFYIEPVIVQELQVLPKDYIRTSVPEGLYSPRWDGTGWVEGLSTVEINTIKNKPIEKTEMDILKEQNEMNAMAIMELAEMLFNS